MGLPKKGEDVIFNLGNGKMMTDQKRTLPSYKIDISYKTFLFGLVLFLLVKFFILTFNILVMIYLSFLLSLLLDPLVEWLVAKGVKRSLSIGISFLVFFILVGGFLGVLIPPLVEQSQNLANSLPQLISRIHWENFDYAQFGFLINKFGDLPISVVRTLISVVSNLVSFFTILVMTYYLLREKPFIPRYLVKIVGNNPRTKVTVQFLDLLDRNLSRWLIGEGILMCFIGGFSYLGLLLLKIPYALPLGMLAGLLEIIPTLGPTISAIPPMIIGLTISPLVAAGVVGWYFLVQQVENNLLVPRIIGSAINVHPFLILLTLMVGFQLGGVGGALLIVPLLVTFKTALEVYLLNKEVR